jgi:hypothetical protein
LRKFDTVPHILSYNNYVNILVKENVLCVVSVVVVVVVVIDVAVVVDADVVSVKFSQMHLIKIAASALFYISDAAIHFVSAIFWISCL